VADYTTKTNHVRRFLEADDKVKVTIMFRGREMAHPELGRNILERVAQDVADMATVETKPNLEGRNMTMMLAPLKKKEPAAPKPAAKPDAEAAPAPKAAAPAPTDAEAAPKDAEAAPKEADAAPKDAEKTATKAAAPKSAASKAAAPKAAKPAPKAAEPAPQEAEPAPSE
ncbi:MAG: translation initiation factor, partial [Thermoleophilia bacterium]|nr:translation initiation factor [Thermoleophilia bacterium]